MHNRNVCIGITVSPGVIDGSFKNNNHRKHKTIVKVKMLDQQADLFTDRPL